MARVCTYPKALGWCQLELEACGLWQSHMGSWPLGALCHALSEATARGVEAVDGTLAPICPGAEVVPSQLQSGAGRGAKGVQDVKGPRDTTGLLALRRGEAKRRQRAAERMWQAFDRITQTHTHMYIIAHTHLRGTKRSTSPPGYPL